MTAWVCGLTIGAAATHDLRAPSLTSPVLWHTILALCVVPPGCSMLAGLYQGRYLRGSTDEVIAVAGAGIATTLALLAVGTVLVPGQHSPREAVVTGALCAILAMLGARYVVFAVQQRSRPPTASAEKIIVFGAGSAGTQLVHRLTSLPDSEYRPVALLDDDPDKRRLRIQGVPVLGDRSRIAQVAASTGARVLVIAIAKASGTAVRDITAEAESCGLTPKVIPSVTELLRGGARIEGVRDPRISDLLGRRPVETDIATVASYFAGKRVLVTGAGGSIGSELCRQLHRLGPAELTMLDRDESALHAVQLALHGRALLDSDETVLADIRDARRVREIFQRYRPEIVFHTAALKHLPLLERYPNEALKTNVWGTLTVLEEAAACGADSFVNISTDKAADPVSVLGHSKRIAERLTAHMAGQTGRPFLSVRFGNVLGSRGSVLTALSTQVAAGGPVTVTHPDVSRYFMTADEAVQLVLQAAVIGRGGEVLVLDMGEPVRIADIARRLAVGSGRDVDIVFTGLRPGEKLTEDLLSRDEADDRPCHPLIRHTPVMPMTPDAVIGIEADADADDARAFLARASGNGHQDLAGPKSIGDQAGRPVQAQPFARSG